MKTNVLIAIGILFIIFGIYIGMCNSQVVFLFIGIGIVIELFAIRQTQVENLK